MYELIKAIATLLTPSSINFLDALLISSVLIFLFILPSAYNLSSISNLKKRGTPYEAEWLYGVWDNMEFFVNGVDWYNEKVVATNGGFYWKDRFESLIVGLQSQDKIPDPYEVPLEDINYGLETVQTLQPRNYKLKEDDSEQIPGVSPVKSIDTTSQLFWRGCT